MVYSQNLVNTEMAFARSTEWAALTVTSGRVASMLADRGMHIAALTPDRFAEWLAEVMG